MRQTSATAAPIIPVFVRRFGIALLLSMLASGAVRAQSAYSLRMTLDYQGKTYEVAPTSLPSDQRTELSVSPVGALRVYVRAIGLPGVAGQALMDMQIYQPRNGSQAQLSSFTMPVYLGTSNSSQMKTVYGDLNVNAYVDLASAGAGGSTVPAAAPPRATQTPLNMGEPVRPQALPAPLPSPLPAPGG
ncbi:MAG: hypothetical protein JWQ90_2277 [Hydrocarboniphaga sp.]|uniref:hypothetical protein n=1 Tax=Hydrocarboniphaga sp. TaxID=2033016 RepID=UPI002634F9DE|nr:hypothetical protein [Hydrocarboniphaga sp.]MDB5969827.1 hypothetical protein [Hydrocarboniphaga sp.]